MLGEEPPQTQDRQRSDQEGGVRHGGSEPERATEERRRQKDAACNGRVTDGDAGV